MAHIHSIEFLTPVGVGMLTGNYAETFSCWHVGVSIQIFKTIVFWLTACVNSHSLGY